MTDLKALRKRIAPGMTQHEFALALGYSDRDAYRRYETGARPTPHLLTMVMQAMADTGWRPADWPLDRPHL